MYFRKFFYYYLLPKSVIKPNKKYDSKKMETSCNLSCKIS